MNDLDLASLLVSRVCHDLVSPVGAVINGLEVIDDDDDPAMQAEALRLIRRSADQASAKLQFARLAFGASGSRGDMMPIGDVREAAARLFEDGKAKLEWRAEEMELPKAQVRCLANLVALGAECLPRGGTVTVAVEIAPKSTQLVVRCQGQGAKFSDDFRAALAGETALDKVEGRMVLAVILGRVARAHGGQTLVETRPDDVVLAAHFTGAVS